MLASLNEEHGYYTRVESDNKYVLKSDVINVDLTEYATMDQVNEVLTENYVQKTDTYTKMEVDGMIDGVVDGTIRKYFSKKR